MTEIDDAMAVIEEHAHKITDTVLGSLCRKILPSLAARIVSQDAERVAAVDAVAKLTARCDKLLAACKRALEVIKTKEARDVNDTAWCILYDAIAEAEAET